MRQLLYFISEGAWQSQFHKSSSTVIASPCQRQGRGNLGLKRDHWRRYAPRNDHLKHLGWGLHFSLLLTKFTPVIASPCEIRDHAYGRVERKVYCPQRQLLYLISQGRGNLGFTRCVAMLLAMTLSKIPIDVGKFKGISNFTLLYERCNEKRRSLKIFESPSLILTYN